MEIIKDIEGFQKYKELCKSNTRKDSGIKRIVWSHVSNNCKKGNFEKNCEKNLLRDDCQVSATESFWLIKSFCHLNSFWLIKYLKMLIVKTSLSEFF